MDLVDSPPWSNAPKDFSEDRTGPQSYDMVFFRGGARAETSAIDCHMGIAVVTACYDMTRPRSSTVRAVRMQPRRF